MKLKVERVDIPETGISSDMKLGWACPNCRELITKQPDAHAPICPKHRIAYHRVVYVEERVDDKMQKVFINMDVFDAAQRNILEALIRKINYAFEWILTHEHAYETVDAAAPGEEKE